MKIAVTYDNGNIFQHFGRTEAFKVYQAEDGKVVSLEVETPDETPGRGQKCSEEAFTSQFIGKTLPVTLGEDVDEVSGATITSTVVVNALNSLVK